MKIRKGHVKTICREHKFSLLTDFDGADWYFHMASLRNRKHWDCLIESSVVDFTTGTNAKGPNVVNVTLAADGTNNPKSAKS